MSTLTNKKQLKAVALLAILYVMCAQDAHGVFTISLSGHTSTLLQISLNGHLGSTEVTDNVVLPLTEGSEKTSTLKVRSNVSNWYLFVQRIDSNEDRGNGNDNSQRDDTLNDFVALQVEPGPIASTFVSPILDLSQLSRGKAKLLFAGSQPTENDGANIAVRYRVTKSAPFTKSFVAQMRYRLTSKP